VQARKKQIIVLQGLLLAFQKQRKSKKQKKKLDYLVLRMAREAFS
jgi:hypothetical protein